jgi:hypothetical protein
MKLVHTLLFLHREDREEEDRLLTANCLKSLEKSTYKTIIVYNQGAMTNDKLNEELATFDLDIHIIGDGVNVGTAAGRQKCFEYIWEHMPDTEYISEIHLDMIFVPHWEGPLVDYLSSHDEPMISCGIMDKNGYMPFLNKKVEKPEGAYDLSGFLANLRMDEVTQGFTNPCVHVSAILKETGGYNAAFLKGRQCFEDDSMLLGYYYYYGTKRAWYPKINFNSVVYHAVAGQRLDMRGNVMVNFNGLVRQYGAMGIKALSTLHKSTWHRRFFGEQYTLLTK